MGVKAKISLLLGGFVLFLSLIAPPLSEANHRNRSLKLAREYCDLSLTGEEPEWLVDQADCAVPLIRQQARRNIVQWSQRLTTAAEHRAKEILNCKPSGEPCGHNSSYWPTKVGYMDSCDTVAEAYQRIPLKKSAGKALNLVLHHGRFSRPFLRGVWRDHGVAIAWNNKYYVLSFIFGRPCSGKKDIKPYSPPPPVNLKPPAADDLLHEKNNGTFKYHVIYAWPSDKPNRFGMFREQINQDVIKAALLPLPLNEKQRSIRFDIGTAQDPNAVDITGEQVPFTSEELLAAAKDNGPGSQGYEDLTRFFRRTWGWNRNTRGRSKNILIYLDLVNSDFCGWGTIGSSTVRDPLSNWGNNNFQTALVYINPKDPSRFCDIRTPRHEIGHNMGALFQEAPSAFDQAHCNDAYEDVMCYRRYKDELDNQWRDTPKRLPKYVAQANDGAFWDFRHDDYWDPVGGKLPWWTTNLSRFVCPDAACTPDGSDMIGFTRALEVPFIGQG